MNATVTRTTPGVQGQTLATVTRANIVRLLTVGGIRSWLITAVVLTVLSTICTVALASNAQFQEIAQLDSASVISSAPMVMLIVLALAATSHIGRDNTDGTVALSKSLVPRTTMLFTGRMLAWAAITAAASTLAVIASVPFALVTPGLPSSSLGTMVATAGASIVASTLVVTFFAAVTTWLKRPVIVIFLGMVILIIVPAAIGIAGAVLQGTLGDVLTTLSSLTPGPLVMKVIQPPAGPATTTWSSWSLATLGLIAWTACTVLAARMRFTQAEYGQP